MKKLPFILIIALIITLAVSVYSDSVETDLEQNLVRLHIIANSDSDADQAVKLMVRDAVINEVDCSVLTPDEAAQKAAETARRVLFENGFTYGAYGEFTKMNFPVRQYRDLTLPAGEYNAVRIVLGSGSGHNWWCVLYPPLCVEDEKGTSQNARTELKNSLNPDTYDIITHGGKKKIKFRTVEAAKKFIEMLKK